MRIDYFKEIVTLADMGNYTAAAECLHLSQSALSRHMMELEEYFGITAFRRTKKELVITQEGMILLQYAQEISDQMKAFYDILSPVDLDSEESEKTE